MKLRSSNAPAGMAMRRVIQYGTPHPMVRNMSASSARYGTTVSISWMATFRLLGFSNRFSPATQGGFAVPAVFPLSSLITRPPAPLVEALELTASLPERE